MDFARQPPCLALQRRRRQRRSRYSRAFGAPGGIPSSRGNAGTQRVGPTRTATAPPSCQAGDESSQRRCRRSLSAASARTGTAPSHAASLPPPPLPPQPLPPQPRARYDTLAIGPWPDARIATPPPPPPLDRSRFGRSGEAVDYTLSSRASLPAPPPPSRRNRSSVQASSPSALAFSRRVSACSAASRHEATRGTRGE